MYHELSLPLVGIIIVGHNCRILLPDVVGSAEFMWVYGSW